MATVCVLSAISCAHALAAFEVRTVSFTDLAFFPSISLSKQRIRNLEADQEKQGKTYLLNWILMKIKSQNRTASFDFPTNEIKTQANVIGFQKQFDLFLIRREQQ